MHESLSIRVTTYALLAIFVFLVAVPLFWMVATALKSNKDLYEDFSYLPTRPTLQHFVRVITREDLLTNIRNSFVGGTPHPVQVPVADGDAVHPALHDRGRDGPRQHAEVAHADLSLVHGTVLHVDADGLLQEYSARAGRARDGRRLLQDRRAVPHPLPAVRAGHRRVRHLLVHAGLERVPPGPGLHQRPHHDDDPDQALDD